MSKKTTHKISEGIKANITSSSVPSWVGGQWIWPASLSDKSWIRLNHAASFLSIQGQSLLYRYKKGLIPASAFRREGKLWLVSTRWLKEYLLQHQAARGLQHQQNKGDTQGKTPLQNEDKGFSRVVAAPSVSLGKVKRFNDLIGFEVLCSATTQVVLMQCQEGISTGMWGSQVLLVKKLLDLWPEFISRLGAGFTHFETADKWKDYQAARSALGAMMAIAYVLLKWCQQRWSLAAEAIEKSHDGLSGFTNSGFSPYSSLWYQETSRQLEAWLQSLESIMLPCLIGLIKESRNKSSG